MKIEWLVTDALAIASPGRAEYAFFGAFCLGVFFANSGNICGCFDKADRAILGGI